jgi:hypothetical protein
VEVLAHHYSYAELCRPRHAYYLVLLTSPPYTPASQQNTLRSTSPPLHSQIVANDSQVLFTVETTWNRNPILSPATILLNSRVTPLAASPTDRVNPLGAPLDKTYVTSWPSLSSPIGTFRSTKSCPQIYHNITTHSTGFAQSRAVGIGSLVDIVALLFGRTKTIVSILTRYKTHPNHNYKV